MKAYNKAYRAIDRATDVLSFPIYRSLREIPPDMEAPLGDIIINLHAAKRQSADYGLSFACEVNRLLIHGFLHLLGYDHEKNKYQAGKMRKKERELLNAFKAMD